MKNKSFIKRIYPYEHRFVSYCCSYELNNCLPDILYVGVKVAIFSRVHFNLTNELVLTVTSPSGTALQSLLVVELYIIQGN